MRIAIAGAGMSGAYLARRLATSGIANKEDITIFDPYFPRRTNCKISPCAWGIHYASFKDFSKLCELDYKEYIYSQFDEVLIDGTRLKGDICTFNKPKFILDCLEGFNVKREALHGNYDIIVDATSLRKIIGYQETEHINLSTRQIRIYTDKYQTHDISIRTIPGIKLGYYWEFPLLDSVHIGYGVATEFVKFFTICKMVKKIYRLPKFEEVLKAQNASIPNSTCSCGGSIRASSPKNSQPLVRNVNGTTIVAVGESAGCISSLTGGGNKEAMDGIEILLDNWEDWEEYSYELIDNFEWADLEYKLIRCIALRKIPNPLDILKIRKNAKRYGIEAGILDTIKIASKVLIFNRG